MNAFPRSGSDELQRIYHLRGLGRILYSGLAEWPEGSFAQVEPDLGVLTLRQRGISTPDQLQRAIGDFDRRANEFLIAQTLDLNIPLRLKLEQSIEPDVDPPGVLRAHATFSAECTADLVMKPRPVPHSMPRAPLESARWVRTLAEASRFNEFADEVVKRAYLLIEELWPAYEPQASSQEVEHQQELKLVRNFVSHPECQGHEVVAFMTRNLPSSVVSGAMKPTVRFDRTSVEHTNFVGVRYQPIAIDLARKLVRAAIGRLSQFRS